MANNSRNDLAKMEYEFATNPNSEAFIPLAEAYLGMGRFVEAMVVCKKGIKAHPELPIGRLIMARIYADQAKHQKAIEELNNLVKLAPNNGSAYRLLGEIHLKIGREEEGIGYLKQSLNLDPNDQQAREELLKRGIDYLPSSAAATAAAPRAFISDYPTEKVLPAVMQSKAAAAQRTAAPAHPAEPLQQRKRIADIYQEMESSKKKRERKGLRYTMYLGVVLVIGLIVYVVYTWQAGERQKKINEHLKEGRRLFSLDSYTGYNQSLEHYRSIYKLDQNYPEALARGAFIAAVLVGEFGASRELLQEGTKYLNQALSVQQNNTMLTTARGLMQLYGTGSMNEAVKLLTDGLKENPDSAVLHTTLGYIMLKKGELSEAREHLLKGAAQSDIRALVGLGMYAMRRSMYREADQAFNRALQSDRNHVQSFLYRGLLALIWGDTPSFTKEALEVLKRFRAELEKEASGREKAFANLIEAILKIRSPETSKAGFNDLKALLKKEGNDALFQFVAARELRRRGKLDEAMNAIGMALRLDSTRPDFVLEESAIFLAKKDYESARARALRVQEMDTESGLSLLLTGDAYLGEKKFDKAKKYYKDATKFEDVEAMSHFKLGQVYLEQPKPDQDLGQAQLELAISGLTTIGERRTASEAAVLLAKIYAGKQRKDEFLNILQSAKKTDPSYATPWCMIADKLRLDDRDGREAAKEHCENCIQLDPQGDGAKNCAEILKKIKKLK